MSFKRISSRQAVLTALAAVALAAGAAAAGTRMPAARHAAPIQDVRHPIEVRVTALGPVAHGRTVRLRVDVTPMRPLERAQVRVVSTGGAALSGRREASLGSVRRDETRPAEFDVVIPAAGRQFLVQFEVQGRSESALLTRGAAYNLLPGGPADSGRRVAGPAGAVLEFGARRIDR
jgi:hypothetical protein